MNATRILAGTLLAALTSGAAAQQTAPPPSLFEPLPASRITRFHEDAAAIRQDNVTLNEELVLGELIGRESAEEVTLNLFPDVSFTGRLMDTEAAYAGGYVVRYDLGNDGWDYAALSVLGDAVSGVVHVGDQIYTIGNVGDGELTVSEIDPSLYEPCGVDASHAVGAQSFGQGSGNGRASGHTAHVMVVFTADCVTAEGGIDGANSLANLAMSEANRALSQGDSTFRLNLVHTYETVYTQSGNQSTDLGRLRDTSDGFMDEVHGFRDAYGADFVELFIANYGSGVAYVNCDGTSSWAGNAFSVGKNTRVAATYTLAHELGHNFGLQHDRANSGGSCTNDYCYGYETTNPTGTTYGSVMSYLGSRRPIFSNPDIDAPNGEPMGVANSEDSARHIGEWYSSFVAFRSGVSIYHQVETTFASNNGSGGNMFDIKPKTDISLTQIAVNSRIAPGSPVDINLWYRTGTWVGHDSSSAGWTQIGSYSGTSAGQDAPTVISLGSAADVIFKAGETYGIYVEATNGIGGDFRYTNGVETYEDSFLRIESGCGKAFGSGFAGSTYGDRIWNGILYYEGAWGAHYLTTEYTGSISTFTGNMFDIEALEDIVISSFEVNVDTPAGTVTGVDVWYRNGTYVGHEGNADGWIFAGTDTKAVSAGPGAGTVVAIGGIELNAGSTYGFYIRAGGGDHMVYSSGSSTTENSDLRIVSGAGLGGTNPFGTLVSGRTWNGTIRYRSASDAPHLVARNMVSSGTGYLEFSNCTPGGQVRSAYSTRGGGPINSAYGTVHLTPPIKNLPNRTADSVGEATLLLSLGANTAGLSVWFQGLDITTGTLTNGVAVTIQ